jgi:uncharacterized RDD family membrane protein YckC
VERGLRGTPSPRAAPFPLTLPRPRYASFGRRFVAFVLIDVPVVGVSGYATGALLSRPLWAFLSPEGLPEPQMREAYALVLGALGYLEFWAYSALLESSRSQATLGKRALGIKVTDLAGERIGLLRAAWRGLLKTFEVVGLGYGFLAVDTSPRAQAMHDQLAGTLVLLRGEPTGG